MKSPKSFFKSESRWNVIMSLTVPAIGLLLWLVFMILRWATQHTR